MKGNYDTNKQTGILSEKKAAFKTEKKIKEERNKDRQTKIVHVKQNKHSLCGKIPAGLLPLPQLVTVDPRRGTLLGFLRHDSKGRKQNTGVRSLKAQNKLSPNCYITFSKGSQTR